MSHRIADVAAESWRVCYFCGHAARVGAAQWGKGKGREREEEWARGAGAGKGGEGERDGGKCGIPAWLTDDTRCNLARIDRPGVHRVAMAYRVPLGRRAAGRRQLASSSEE